jgi:membrane fusion protein (multidrug efflux system)
MNKLFTGIALLLSAGLFSCGGKQQKPANPAAAPVAVTVTEVQLQPALYYDEYPGNINALNEVELRGQVNGYVTGIFFKEGDRVRKGQKLYEIDRSKYQASYSQAQAGVRVAQANQSRAQKDLDRYVYLDKQDAVAKQVLDHAATDLENAKSQVASAQADLVKAQSDLSYAVITAPFDGTIGLSQVKLGALVTAGQTLLNTISNDDPVAVDFVVNEKEVGRFQGYQKGSAKAIDSLFTIRLPDRSLYPAVGKIYVIDRAVDPQTGTIRIRLVFPNQQHSLKSGMSCIVRVHNEEVAPQLVIPFKAVTEQMGEYFVFVVNGDKVTEQKIAMGTVIGDKVIVKDGLKQGDKIVVDGVQKLHDGSAITLNTKPADAGAKAAH